MYFYEIEVHYPILGSDKIVMSHDDRFDNHQLNIIVQEAFDECVEKYCDKTVLEKGEEACRMDVETIFEKHLPSQLKNHGFNSIKINETCSIQSGTLFAGDTTTNLILKNRYKDEILPPCKKCMREIYFDYDGKCVVPNKRKDTNLPTTHVVKTIPINLNEKEEADEGEDDDFNVEIMKLYFNTPKKYKVAKKVIEAVSEIISNHNLQNFWVDVCDSEDSVYHVGDVLCSFFNGIDDKKLNKIFTNYGFVIEDAENGFWITGVKE